MLKLTSKDYVTTQFVCLMWMLSVVAIAMLVSSHWCVSDGDGDVFLYLVTGVCLMS